MRLSKLFIGNCFLSTDKPLLRDIADSLGGAYAACKEAISKVMQVAGRSEAVGAAFNRAARFIPMMNATGTSGRSFKPLLIANLFTPPERKPS